MFRNLKYLLFNKVYCKVFSMCNVWMKKCCNHRLLEHVQHCPTYIWMKNLLKIHNRLLSFLYTLLVFWDQSSLLPRSTHRFFQDCTSSNLDTPFKDTGVTILFSQKAPPLPGFTHVELWMCLAAQLSKGIHKFSNYNSFWKLFFLMVLYLQSKIFTQGLSSLIIAPPSDPTIPV